VRSGELVDVVRVDVLLPTAIASSANPIERPANDARRRAISPWELLRLTSMEYAN
jgi:hypothetical protein